MICTCGATTITCTRLQEARATPNIEGSAWESTENMAKSYLHGIYKSADALPKALSVFHFVIRFPTTTYPMVTWVIVRLANNSQHTNHNMSQTAAVLTGAFWAKSHKSVTILSSLQTL